MFKLNPNAFQSSFKHPRNENFEKLIDDIQQGMDKGDWSGVDSTPWEKIETKHLLHFRDVLLRDKDRFLASGCSEVGLAHVTHLLNKKANPYANYHPESPTLFPKEWRPNTSPGIKWPKLGAEPPEPKPQEPKGKDDGQFCKGCVECAEWED